MISDEIWMGMTPQERHEKTWRRADESRVFLKDMETMELKQVIANIQKRIDEEENKLLTNPAYENFKVSSQVNALITNSKEKLLFLKQELEGREGTQ